MTLNVIWGLLLLILFILWILTQVSPYMRDHFDGMKESVDQWWAIDTEIRQPHLRNGHFRYMVDSTCAQRKVYRKQRPIPRNSKRMKRCSHDSQCYILDGEEYCE